MFKIYVDFFGLIFMFFIHLQLTMNKLTSELTEKRRIYISGRITGYEFQHAYNLFEKSENKIFESNLHEPVNPMKLAHGHDKSWLSFMLEDLAAALTCNAIYMHKDWYWSEGARIEFNLMNGLKFPIVKEDPTDKTVIVNLQAEYLCTFHSFSNWVNNASSWIGGYSKSEKLVCVDKYGNVLTCGTDFQHNKKHDLFPVQVYRLIRSSERDPNTLLIGNGNN